MDSRREHLERNTLSPLVLAEYPLRFRRAGLLIMGFLVISAFLLFAAMEISRRQNYHINGDFFELWLGGRMIWGDQSLYDETQWMAEHAHYGNQWDNNSVFPYPPPLALVFAPLGILSLKSASILWVFFSQLMVLISVVLLIALWNKRNTRAISYILPSLAAIFLFRPVMVTLRNGQLSAFFLIILVLTMYFWEKDHWFIGGLLLSMITLRPNLGLLILGFIGIWLLVRRCWSAILGTIISFISLLGISWMLEPQWIENWLMMSDGKLMKTFGYHPNLWGISSHLCGRNLLCTINVGCFLILALYLVCTLFLFQSKLWEGPSLALAIACPLALLITPYLWAYDLTLLIIPTLVAAGFLIEIKLPYLAVTLYPLAISSLALVFLFIALRVGDDAWSASVSIVTILILVFIRFCKKDSNPLPSLPQFDSLLRR
jgi:hypothetical protein